MISSRTWPYSCTRMLRQPVMRRNVPCMAVDTTPAAPSFSKTSSSSAGSPRRRPASIRWQTSRTHSTETWSSRSQARRFSTRRYSSRSAGMMLRSSARYPSISSSFARMRSRSTTRHLREIRLVPRPEGLVRPHGAECLIVERVLVTDEQYPPFLEDASPHVERESLEDLHVEVHRRGVGEQDVPGRGGIGWTRCQDEADVDVRAGMMIPPGAAPEQDDGEAVLVRPCPGQEPLQLPFRVHAAGSSIGAARGQPGHGHLPPRVVRFGDRTPRTAPVDGRLESPIPAMRSP